MGTAIYKGEGFDVLKKSMSVLKNLIEECGVRKDLHEERFVHEKVPVYQSKSTFTVSLSFFGVVFQEQSWFYWNLCQV